MFLRAFTRFVPVGMAATVTYQSQQLFGKEIIFIKPTSCSDDNDDEFTWRHILVEQLTEEGNKSMIPKNLFHRQDDKFVEIPESLMNKYRAIIASGKSSSKSILKITDENKPKKEKKSVAEIESSMRQITALHSNGILYKAQHDLDKFIRQDHYHSIRNLPESAINILPPTLRATRIEYEEKGARIDCALLSTVRLNDSALLVPSNSSTYLPKKKTKLGSPSKPSKPKHELELLSSDEETPHISFDLNDMSSAVSKLSSVTERSSEKRASVKRKSDSKERSARNNSHHKCDNDRCGCSKRVYHQGCCDVCRIHFDCQCNDCTFMKGRESGSLAMMQERIRTHDLLINAAAEYAHKSQDENKRLGYIFERRKETIVRELNGREEHNWRVGTITGYIECCDKAFRRFYKTSTKTLNTMKSREVEINAGVPEVTMSSTISSSKSETSNRMTSKDLKTLCKTFSTAHGIVLDEDEKASLRWAPSKNKSSDDECYGWLFETFGDVAEDMPNRYDFIQSCSSIIKIFILLLHFIFIGEESVILLSLA